MTADSVSAAPTAADSGANSPQALEWDVRAIVGDLRALRDNSLAARQRSRKPVKLPSRKALTTIAENISAALFPHRMSPRELADGVVDFFVGHLLDTALRTLVEQVVLEFQFSAAPIAPERQRAEAIAIVRRFAANLIDIRAMLETDIAAAYAADPTARTLDEVLACCPGVVAMTHYRLANALHREGAPLVARIIADIARSTTGIEIHPGADIAESFFIDHGTGVVIGETARIGKRVRFHHAVTLGARHPAATKTSANGDGAQRHPIVEDDVVIYAGATLLGPITVGRGSVIGGNVWLTSNVPPGSVISQAKPRSEDFEAGSGI